MTSALVTSDISANAFIPIDPLPLPDEEQGRAGEGVAGEGERMAGDGLALEVVMIEMAIKLRCTRKLLRRCYVLLSLRVILKRCYTHLS